MEKFVLQDGSEIVDISSECDYEALTSEEKIQYMMLQISRHMMKFITDIAIDCEVDKFFSCKITGDGTYYMIELCNGHTKVIVGKMWNYQEILEMMIKPKAIESEINSFVRLAIMKTKQLVATEDTIWL